MPALHSPLTPPCRSSTAERRQWLAMACELDRLNVRIECRRLSKASRVPALIGKLAALAPNAPGGVGKWVRAASLGAALYKAANFALRD